MLDFPTFATMIGDTIGLDLSTASPDSLLHDDLLIDSLCMTEILIRFADHGVTLPDALIGELRTLGDLHHYFTTLAPRPPLGEVDPIDPVPLVDPVGVAVVR